MLSRHRTFPVCVLLAVTGLSACSDSGGGPTVDIPVDDARATIGAAGGSVASGAVSIDIPAGALVSDVEISIGQADPPVVLEGVVVVGPTVEIGPSGTTFAIPARVTLPFVAGALPSGAGPADIRLYTADSAGGPFTALPSIVDGERATVSADVSHLSRFVPGVPPGSGGETFLCPTHGDCDCEAHFAERPLTVLGQATLAREQAPRRGRYIDRMCYRGDTDTLEVLGYTLPPEPDCTDGCSTDELFVEPDGWFLTVLDGATLDVLSDEATADPSLSPGACAPFDPNRLAADEQPPAAPAWRVRIDGVPEHELTFPPPIAFYDEVLEVGGAQLSFNRHLNQGPPYTDANSLFDNPGNSAEARWLDDGGARFYLYVWFGQHIDVIHIDDFEAFLAAAPEAADADGFVAADVVERIEIAPGDHPNGYAYDALHIAPDPADPSADILVAMSRTGSAVQGYRIRRGPELEPLEVTALPELGLDVYYSQFGWQNGGLDAEGRLLLQSNAAGFTNSQILALDPARFTRVESWEMGCLGPPEPEGFAAIPWATGQVLRFAFETTGFPGDRVMFAANGAIQAAGAVPYEWAIGQALVLLTDGATRRAYVGHRTEGIITALAVP